MYVVYWYASTYTQIINKNLNIHILGVHAQNIFTDKVARSKKSGEHRNKKSMAFTKPS